MAEIIFENLHKIYDNGVVALQGFSLTVADGEFLVLVGPSGCGKSTALRCLAGLETPTSGTIRLNGRVINPLPPQDRDLAMVFQNYALYPHMTVFENLSFGLRLRGQSRPEIRQRVQAVAAKLGITHHLPRRPRELSGGERQRVALGRAMVRQPQAFLMDEPLSNLDAALRLKMRTELLQLQRDLGATFVYVTHDQTEAMTMGHRVAVLHQGVLQQVASPLDLYEHPANRFVAGFIGSPAMNFLTGRLSRTAAGLTLTLARQPLPLPADLLEQHPALGDWLEQPLQVGIRPEHFQAAEGPPEGEIRLRVRVAVVETLGAVNYVHFRLADHQDQPDSDGDLFTAALSPQTPVRAGEDLELAVDPVHCHFFEPDSGKVL